jgi:hypothetical protein
MQAGELGAGTESARHLAGPGRSATRRRGRGGLAAALARPVVLIWVVVIAAVGFLALLCGTRGRKAPLGGCERIGRSPLGCRPAHSCVTMCCMAHKAMLTLHVLVVIPVGKAGSQGRGGVREVNGTHTAPGARACSLLHCSAGSPPPSSRHARLVVLGGARQAQASPAVRTLAPCRMSCLARRGLPGPATVACCASPRTTNPASHQPAAIARASPCTQLAGCL